MPKIRLLSILVILFPIALYAQNLNDDKTVHHFSVIPKVGFYNWSDGGLAVGMEFKYNKNTLFYALDYLHLTELDTGFFSPSPIEYNNQIGFMIGKHFGEGLLQFLLQGGVGPFWGLKRTDLIENRMYDHKKFLTVGLIAKTGLTINPFHFLGLGLDVQLNLNPEKTVYVPTCSLVFNIRSKRKH
ncbi:hypothetical protein [Sediminicola luteus]|uniref:Outer membrane protein beta-barrel domain-containing protein n=1 Tax=Sediminicola luteus TaxID=319238 RepID=A0A2A4G5T7_9FLAO|nr:hypothetical protein [Sediminicola luteus]PCE63793.1 hypothetical protein B7P33_11005 [Sediminicola luteus]